MNRREFFKIYKNLNGDTRLCQLFVNLFIKDPWPELYYADNEKSYDIISVWLRDNHYFGNELPSVIKSRERFWLSTKGDESA